MRLRYHFVLSLFACVTMVAVGQAQPIAPPVPAVPAVPAVPVAPVAAPAQPANLWTWLCPPQELRDRCKARICNSFLFQMFGSMLSPVRIFTGGMMKPCCPSVNPADLLMPPDSAAGAAALIKKDEADAAARRANVRYLGTVDCSRYPEAEAALIKALRTDRNECVRLEAALSLGNGCCCTKKTVDALLLTVNCSEKDGNPIEISPRVRCAAADALAHCEGRPIDHTQEPPERVPLPEGKAAAPPVPVVPVVPAVPIVPAVPVVPVLPAPAPVPGAPPPMQILPAPSPTPLPPTPVPPTPLPPTLPPPVPVPAGELPPVPAGQRGLFQIFMRRAQASSSNGPGQ
jgi:hypothetical protein